MTAEEILAMFEKAKQMNPEELAAFAAQQAQTGTAKQDSVTVSAGNYFSRCIEKGIARGQALRDPERGAAWWLKAV